MASFLGSSPGCLDLETNYVHIPSLCSLSIGLMVSDHYLPSHNWDHIIKKRVFRVFLWTFGLGVGFVLFHSDCDR